MGTRLGYSTANGLIGQLKWEPALTHRCAENPVLSPRSKRLLDPRLAPRDDAGAQPPGPTGDIREFQEAGFVICLNEIALPVAFAAFFAHSIAQGPPCIKASFLKQTRELADAIGGVAAMEKGRPRFRLD